MSGQEIFECDLCGALNGVTKQELAGDYLCAECQQQQEQEMAAVTRRLVLVIESAGPDLRLDVSCERCTHWVPPKYDGALYGDCGGLAPLACADGRVDGGSIQTERNFGCVQFDPKETP